MSLMLHMLLDKIDERGVALYKNKPNSDVDIHHFYKKTDTIIHEPRMYLDLSNDRLKLLPTTIFSFVFKIAYRFLLIHV